MKVQCLLQILALSLLLFCSVTSGQQQCTEAEECYPSGYAQGGISVPPSYVNCTDGSCVCRDCFIFDSPAGTCVVDTPCWTFSTSNGSCEDRRRSQRTAVILAALLSVVGAANFYVARYEYAVSQLALFLCLIIASVFGRVLRYVLDDKGRDTEKFCALCSTVSAAVIAILALGTIISWWIGDMVIFIQNTRTDGKNCPLRHDL